MSFSKRAVDAMNGMSPEKKLVAVVCGVLLAGLAVTSLVGGISSYVETRRTRSAIEKTERQARDAQARGAAMESQADDAHKALEDRSRRIEALDGEIERVSQRQKSNVERARTARSKLDEVRKANVDVGGDNLDERKRELLSKLRSAYPELIGEP